MGRLITPTSGVIFASIIYDRSRHTFDEVVRLISSRYELGEILHPEYNPLLEYYSKEMGPDLSRFIFVSKERAQREELVLEKKWAYDQELHFTDSHQQRSLNIDTGIILSEQLLLSTTKPYAHRIYIGVNTWVELVYTFQNKSYRPLEWTYPDYAHEEKILFFNRMRSKFL